MDTRMGTKALSASAHRCNARKPRHRTAARTSSGKLRFIRRNRHPRGLQCPHWRHCILWGHCLHWRHWILCAHCTHRDLIGMRNRPHTVTAVYRGLRLAVFDLHGPTGIEASPHLLHPRSPIRGRLPHLPQPEVLSHSHPRLLLPRRHLRIARPTQAHDTHTDTTSGPVRDHGRHHRYANVVTHGSSPARDLLSCAPATPISRP